MEIGNVGAHNGVIHPNWIDKKEEDTSKTFGLMSITEKIASWVTDGGLFDLFKTPEGKEKEAMDDAATIQYWSDCGLF